MTLLEEASLSCGITTACQVSTIPRSWYYRQKAAVVEAMLWPAREEKYSLFSNDELSQNA